MKNTKKYFLFLSLILCFNSYVYADLEKNKIIEENRKELNLEDHPLKINNDHFNLRANVVVTPLLFVDWLGYGASFSYNINPMFEIGVKYNHLFYYEEDDFIAGLIQEKTKINYKMYQGIFTYYPFVSSHQKTFYIEANMGQVNRHKYVQATVLNEVVDLQVEDKKYFGVGLIFGNRFQIKENLNFGLNYLGVTFLIHKHDNLKYALAPFGMDVGYSF